MIRKTLAGLLAGAAALLATAPAHAAGPKGDDYWFAPGSKLIIVDDEWGKDEIGQFDLSNVYLGRLGDHQTGEWFKVTRCVGGEVKVVVTAHVWRQSATSSLVRYYLDLYEGVSCSTDDLDGHADIVGWASLSSKYFLETENEDEGGDYAQATLSVKKTNAY